MHSASGRLVNAVQQLLWIETLVKLTAGLLLVLMPRTTIKVFGLPRAETGFWPRLLGALLVGLAGALFLEGSVAGSRGLGLAGCVIVNFSGASIMATLMVLNAGPSSARGRAVLWMLVVFLLFLSILEVANL